MKYVTRWVATHSVFRRDDGSQMAFKTKASAERFLKNAHASYSLKKVRLPVIESPNAWGMEPSRWEMLRKQQVKRK